MIQVGKLGKTNPHTHLATAGLHLPLLRFTCALSKKQVAWIICLLSLQWLALLLPVSDVVAVVGWLSFLIEAWLDPVTAPSLSKRRRSEQQHSGRLAFKWHLSLCSFLFDSFFSIAKQNGQWWNSAGCHFHSANDRSDFEQEKECPSTPGKKWLVRPELN